MSVLRIIERDLTIAYKVAYTRIPGSDHTCALFLSQVAYWCGNSSNGWAWLTHDSLEAQTGMGRKSQDRAAAFWCSVGVLNKELRGLPAKIHYNVDFDQLEKLLVTTKVVQNGQPVMSKTDNHSIEDSLETLQQAKQPAAPSPSAPEKSKKSITVREQELAQKLLDIWNSASDHAKANARRFLPRSLKFPVDAMPSMKKYMKAYSDEEIMQLVTDGSRSVQKNDFYHERKYGLVNLMRNLEANARLTASPDGSKDVPDGTNPIPKAPSPFSAHLTDDDPW